MPWLQTVAKPRITNTDEPLLTAIPGRRRAQQYSTPGVCRERPAPGVDDDTTRTGGRCRNDDGRGSPRCPARRLGSTPCRRPADLERLEDRGHLAYVIVYIRGMSPISEGRHNGVANGRRYQQLLTCRSADVAHNPVDKGYTRQIYLHTGSHDAGGIGRVRSYRRRRETPLLDACRHYVATTTGIATLGVGRRRRDP